MSTPTERTATARAALWKMSREMFHDEEYANATIDAYALAVRAEAFEEVRVEAMRRCDLERAAWAREKRDADTKEKG